MIKPPTTILLFLFPILIACAACKARSTAAAEVCPLPGAKAVDELIEADERHFAHLWQLTRGGENAEAYWSFAGDRLVLQRRDTELGIDCDRIFLTDIEGGELQQVSNGEGVTTCSYFLPGDQQIVFSSTHGHQQACPPPPDFSRGYVWSLHPEYDMWRCELDGSGMRVLAEHWGYDAEPTVSPLGDRIVFTSTRSGDLELWTCDLDGGDLFQVTDEPGYDGGAFFSNDGKRLIFRSTAFTPGKEEEELADYRALLAEWRVRPSNMEIMCVDADGTNRRQITQLGKANFAPFFFPDDERVIFATNHHSEGQRNFDLFAIGLDGEGLERITSYEGFDSFPMFSPDGRFLAFSSNRGGTKRGETNVFIAAWSDVPLERPSTASRDREVDPGQAAAPAQPEGHEGSAPKEGR